MGWAYEGPATQSVKDALLIQTSAESFLELGYSNSWVISEGPTENRCIVPTRQCTKHIPEVNNPKQMIIVVGVIMGQTHFQE